jgi:REP element-mobilizing transposase RayT/DNA-binding NarL/FixJ family response regulator
VKKNILVATPQVAFGELIRLSLEEDGNFQVRLVQTTNEVMASASYNKFDVAILDAELSAKSFAALTQSLLEVEPDLRLVVIPPDNNPERILLDGITFDGFLNQPFYLPDLLDLINKITGDQATMPPESTGQADTTETKIPPKSPAWLMDVNRVAQLLTGSLLESSAHAAMIARSGQVISYAGQLTEPALKEMRAVLSRYWCSEEKTDLARYVRLDSNGGEYLLYATGLEDELVLALIYDVTSPISRIRVQTNSLARTLAATSVEVEEEAVDPLYQATLIDKPLKPLSPPPPEISEETTQSKVAEEPDDIASTAYPAQETIAAIADEPVPALSHETTGQPVAIDVPEEEAPVEAAEIPELDETPVISAESLPVAAIDVSQHEEPTTVPAESESASITTPIDLSGLEHKVPAPLINSVAPAYYEDELESDDSESDLDEAYIQANLAVLLANMPSPDPEARPAAVGPSFIPASLNSDATGDPAGDFTLPWEQPGVMQPAGNDDTPTTPVLVAGSPGQITPLFDNEDQEIEEEAPAIQSLNVSQATRPDSGWVRGDEGNAPRQPGAMLPEQPSAGHDFYNATRAPVEVRRDPQEVLRNIQAAQVQTPPVLPVVENPPQGPAAGIGEATGVLQNLDKFDQTFPGLSQLYYTCVLVPRMPKHFLTGEYGESLSQWLPELCLAYGWRLEALSVRPDHLNWSVNAQPSITPASIVRVVRQQTSERLFNHFPTLRSQNPGGDFWAPGYLIASGCQSLSPDLIRDYIQQTRRRQGLLNP